MEYEKSIKANLNKSIYELRQMAFNNNSDIEELLRKAYLISVATRQKNIEEWILNEQNGYKNVNNLPDYRNVQGELKAYNCGKWVSVTLNKQDQTKLLSNMQITESISKIVEAYKNSSNEIASYSITDELTQVLNKGGSFVTVYNFFVSTGQLKQLISSVQNTILHWTIELEESGYTMDRGTIDSTEGKSQNDKEEVILKTVNIFLSYCWNDSNEAD